jgi:hypothetical protein
MGLLQSCGSGGVGEQADVEVGARAAAELGEAGDETTVLGGGGASRMVGLRDEQKKGERGGIGDGK